MSGRKRDRRRAQSYASTATAGEFGKPSTSRARQPHGYGELSQLAAGITETHNNEEKKLFNTKHEVNKLLESLLKSKENINEGK